MGLHGLGGIGRAGGVARVVEHEPLGAGRDGRFQVLGAQLEAVVLAAGDEHRLAIGQRDDVGVADPAGRGDDHLVVLVQRGDHRVEDHLLAAGGDDDLLRLVVDAAVALELGGDGFAQGAGAGDVGVLGVTALDGGDCRVLDELGRVEIGLALGEGDHVPPSRFQGPCLGGNGDGEARADPIEAFGGQVGHEAEPLRVARKTRHPNAVPCPPQPGANAMLPSPGAG